MINIMLILNDLGVVVTLVWNMEEYSGTLDNTITFLRKQIHYSCKHTAPISVGFPDPSVWYQSVVA